MKRKQRISSSVRGGQGKQLDGERLAAVRGGSLGITVSVDNVPSDIMQQQHNETLVAL